MRLSALRSWFCPLFPLDREIADIPPAEAAGPVDLVDGRVGARLRLGDRLGGRRDAEHASAIGGGLVARRPWARAGKPPPPHRPAGPRGPHQPAPSPVAPDALGFPPRAEARLAV